jgi:hypothetical protein
LRLAARFWRRVTAAQVLHTRALPGTLATLARFGALARLYPGTLLTCIVVVRPSFIHYDFFACLFFVLMHGTRGGRGDAHTLFPHLARPASAVRHLLRHLLPAAPPSAVRRRQPHHQRAAAARQVRQGSGCAALCSVPLHQTTFSNDARACTVRLGCVSLFMHCF